MSELRIRCSAVGHLMTEPKTVDDHLRTPEIESIIASKKRTDFEKALLEDAKLNSLSAGAKTYVRALAAQDIFGFDPEINARVLEKGIECEPDSLALLNRVRGLSLVKNTERREDDILSGECDLFNAPVRRGHDLKTSWSMQTFPIVQLDAENAIYEWQMRGYMRLWDADWWEVNYCLVNTPERLIGFESPALHFVDHIPEHQRVTSWVIERDRLLEDQMVIKVKAARRYYAQVIAEFDRLHPDPHKPVAPAKVASLLKPATAAVIPPGKPVPVQLAELPDFFA